MIVMVDVTEIFLPDSTSIKSYENLLNNSLYINNEYTSGS